MIEMETADELVTKTDLILQKWGKNTLLPITQSVNNVSSIATSENGSLDRKIEGPKKTLERSEASHSDRHASTSGRSSKKRLKAEINKKIEKLERELDILLRQKSGVHNESKYGENVEMSLDLNDVVSSQCSSNRNVSSNNMNKSLETTNCNSGVGKTFRKTTSNDSKRRYCVLKKRINETKEIMDRGLMTTRRLNKELDRIKAKQSVHIENSMKLVENNIQKPIISPPKKEVPNFQEYAIVENLTSILLEPKTSWENHRPNQPVDRNVGYVIFSNCEQSPKSRLAVRKLPGHDIRDPLSIQAGPQLNIAPLPIENISKPENIKVLTVQHESSKNEISSHEGRINRKPSPVFFNDACIQVALSSTSSLVENQKERKSSRRNNNDVVSGVWTRNDRIIDFVNRVRASRELCQQFNSKRNADEPSTSYTEKSASQEVQLVNGKKAENYESDFEMDSALLDDAGSSSRSRLVFREMADLKKSPTPQNSTPRSMSSSDKHESAIEEQMKRLGLSPLRSSSSKSKARRDSSRKASAVPFELITSDGAHDPPILFPSVFGNHTPLCSVPKINRTTQTSPTPIEIMNGERQKSRDCCYENKIVQTVDSFNDLHGDVSSSMVEKLNKRLERTQLLLERINAGPSGDDLCLQMLRKRGRADGRSSRANRTSPKNDRRRIMKQKCSSKSEGEIGLFREDECTISIGEISGLS